MMSGAILQTLSTGLMQKMATGSCSVWLPKQVAVICNTEKISTFAAAIEAGPTKLATNPSLMPSLPRSIC